MSDGLNLVCPVCGKTADLSGGLTPNEDGQLLCDSCGGEIPIPLAAPDESLSDATAAAVDAATVVDPLPQAPRATDSSVESELGDCGSGRYSQQSTIGKGGMGEIVLCVEQNTRREVAMKRMLPTAAGHAKHRARFVEEAQVTAQLEHPNIVPVHELGRDEHGAIYFTMKLVKGRSLAEILIASREGDESHSLVELLQVFLKVCDGVAFAHSRGVVHRDLKPANIMVGDFGEVLVMDWGIARIIGRDDMTEENFVQSNRQDMDAPAMQTIVGSVMGSPSYMPPEQAAGEIDKIDHRSDIYSLGAILYTILTLKCPVEGRDARTMIDTVIAGNIQTPEKRTPDRDIPRELSAVAMKCLAKYRRGRYASVPELQRDISLYLEGRSVSAAPDTFGQGLVKLIKRNKGISVAVAAATVILIAVVSVAFVGITGAMRRAISGEQQAVTAQQQQRATALAASKRFAMQAIRAAETGRLDEADRRVQDAETVALASPWGLYARGMFARGDNDFQSAADMFTKALDADPTHTESKAALSETLASMGDLDRARKMLADVGKVTDWRAMLKVGRTLCDTGRWKDSQTLLKRGIELMEETKDAPKGIRVVTAREVQEKVLTNRAKIACIGFADQIKNIPPNEQVKRVGAKFEEVNGAGVKIGTVEIENGEWIKAVLPKETRFLDPLRGLPLKTLMCCSALVSDLEPLRGMPLTGLNCLRTGVKDLAPLTGMPLTTLVCYSTLISDLEPLRGMHLKSLNCNQTSVKDLTPLKGMPLEDLSISRIKVADLAPLKGMKLMSLNCQLTSVSDLDPLKGMPLIHLRCENTRISDLTPLAGMELKDFTFSPGRITKGIEIIRGMKSIRKIGIGGPNSMAPEEFWKKYDAGEFNK